MNLNTYATLTDIRTRQGLAAADTGDDTRLLAKLRAATAQIERYTGRHFCPVLATRKFDWFSPKLLLFRGLDLLELTSVTNGDNTAVAAQAMISLGGVQGSIYGIELDPALDFFRYATTKTRAISVTGVWGWHDDYANAWKPAGENVVTMTSNATTFTAASATGTDGWGLLPRFQVGQLIQLDAEYMHVGGVSGNTVTVIRGANGSTAAAHSASSTPIYSYVPPVDISEICLRWAAWLYKQEDAGDYSGITGSKQMGSLSVPPDLPADLMRLLAGLRVGAGAV